MKTIVHTRPWHHHHMNVSSPAMDWSYPKKIKNTLSRVSQSSCMVKIRPISENGRLIKRATSTGLAVDSAGHCSPATHLVPLMEEFRKFSKSKLLNQNINPMYCYRSRYSNDERWDRHLSSYLRQEYSGRLQNPMKRNHVLNTFIQWWISLLFKIMSP